MIRSSCVSESTRLRVSASAESSSALVSRAMRSTSRASSASSRPAVRALPARSAWYPVQAFREERRAWVSKTIALAFV